MIGKLSGDIIGLIRDFIVSVNLVFFFNIFDFYIFLIFKDCFKYFFNVKFYKFKRFKGC